VHCGKFHPFGFANDELNFKFEINLDVISFHFILSHLIAAAAEAAAQKKGI
jgi:hypothetical protein